MTESPEIAPDSFIESDKKRLLARVSSALKDGTLELPSLPDVALEIRQIAMERDLDAAELVRVIQQDPGLSAYILKISNSVHYRRAQRVSSLASAVSRLGIDTTRNFASSYAIRALFYIRDPAIKAHMRNIWKRSVYTGSLAHVIAKHCGFAPEKALLGGILQDIGALPLLAELREFPRLTAKPAFVQELLSEYTGKISAMVLKTWEFDKAMVVVGLDRENWWRDRGPKPELADLVLVARYHSYIGQPNFKNLPPLSELPAFKKLNLGELGPEEGLLFIKEAKAELETLRQALL
jgi:HD-like signal output (HDOD) protein